MQILEIQSAETMDKPTQDRFNRVDADLRELIADLKETNRRVYDVVGSVRELKESVEKKHEDAHWVIRFIFAPLVVLLVTGVIGLAYHSLDNRLNAVEATLGLIPAQITAAKYSSVSAQELSAHREELVQVKNRLANEDRNTPNFWLTSFQIINLLSKATSPVEPKRPSLDLTNIDGGNVPNVFAYPPGSVIKLHKRIANITLKDAIVYLDSDVVLQNVTFERCTLILPDVQVPPLPLQQIGNQLLAASNLSHLVLTAS
jgi:hypothetical protein